MQLFLSESVMMIPQQDRDGGCCGGYTCVKYNFMESSCYCDPFLGVYHGAGAMTKSSDCEFCPFSFKNGASVVSQSTAKNYFFDCLTYTTGVFHRGLMIEFGAGCEIIVGV